MPFMQRVVLVVLLVAATQPVGGQSSGARRELTMDEALTKALREQLAVAAKQRPWIGGLPRLQEPDRSRTRVIAVLPGGATAAPGAPVSTQCPMPVARIDRRTVVPMPVARADSTRLERMPVSRPACVNPFEPR